MSSLRLSGTTSGYYDLTVPAVAGTNSIDLSTLPDFSTVPSKTNLGTSNITHGSNTGDTRFTLNSANQYTLRLQNAGNIAGQIGGNGADDLQFSNAAGAATMVIKDGGVTIPNQPMVQTYYTGTNQHGAYNAGTSRNVVVCKPAGVRLYKGNNMYDVGTGRYTAQIAGVYYAVWGGSQYNNNVTNYFMIQIRINGSSQKHTYFNKTNLGSWVHLTGSAYFQMAVGDYIDFYSNNDSAGGDKGGFDVSNYTNFSVRMVG